jgi:hypothetical protein
MKERLMKASPSRSEAEELEFDPAYYASFDTATRFRMIVERSILLLQLARRDAASSSAPPLAKRL